MCASSLYRTRNTLDINKTLLNQLEKDPNLLAQKLQMNKTEKNYIKQCVRSLEKGNITDNEDDGEYFVPNKKPNTECLNTTTKIILHKRKNK